MGNTIVHLIITGIVALSPAYDGATKLDAWDVVVPTIASGSGHEPHVPHLMAIESVSSGGSPEVGSAFLGDGTQADVNVWTLDNAHLSVVGKPGGTHSDVMPADLLLMSHACTQKDCSKLRRDLIDPRYSTPSGKAPAAARIRIPGQLVATWVDEGSPWYFVREGTTYPSMVIAQEICLLFEVPATKLEVLIAEADVNEYAIAVEPIIVGGKTRIELRLANLPQDEILGDTCPPSGQVEDHHFQAYYDMSRAVGAFERAQLMEGSASGRVIEPHKHQLTLRRPPDKICVASPSGSNCPPTGWDDPYP